MWWSPSVGGDPRTVSPPLATPARSAPRPSSPSFRRDTMIRRPGPRVRRGPHRVECLRRRAGPVSRPRGFGRGTSREDWGVGCTSQVAAPGRSPCSGTCSRRSSWPRSFRGHLTRSSRRSAPAAQRRESCWGVRHSAGRLGSWPCAWPHGSWPTDGEWRACHVARGSCSSHGASRTPRPSHPHASFSSTAWVTGTEYRPRQGRRRGCGERRRGSKSIRRIPGRRSRRSRRSRAGGSREWCTGTPTRHQGVTSKPGGAFS